MRAPVFVFHSWSDENLRLLERTVALAEELGVAILPLRQVIDWLFYVRHYIPQPCLSITLDDGSNADLSLAVPILKGHPATSFVIGSPQWREELDPERLTEWWMDGEAVGLTIQNHSWSHGLVTPANREEARLQVASSAKYIANVSGHYPDIYAYAMGYYNDYMTTRYFPYYWREHRTRCAFTGDPVDVVRGQSKKWKLGRYVALGHFNNDDDIRRILIKNG